jgi:GNAT superfamily N-acetyltransferase
LTAFQVEIRAARRQDRTELEALKIRSSLAWGDHVDELLALPEARQVPVDHLPFVIVADFAGEIVGFATVLPCDGLEAALEDLFVAPELWRNGIGSALMAEVERRARLIGAHSLHVVAGDRARPFYEACGFEVVGTVMTKFAPASGMRKNLHRP